MFYVYNPAVPAHHLYGVNPLILDTDVISELGIYIDLGEQALDAQIHFGENTMEYYIDTLCRGYDLQTGSLDDLRIYIYQK